LLPLFLRDSCLLLSLALCSLSFTISLLLCPDAHLLLLLGLHFSLPGCSNSLLFSLAISDSSLLRGLLLLMLSSPSCCLFGCGARAS